MVTKTSCDNIIADKIEFKAKKKRSKETKRIIFHILKRCNYPGNYNINPNGVKKLPELHNWYK